MADRPPPSAAAIAIGTAIVSGLMGYYIGQAQSIGVFGGSQKSPATLSGVSRAKGKDEAEDEDEDDDDDDGEEEEEEESIEGLKSFDGNTEECKMVFVVRTDLGMTKGKIAAQCSHATLACYKTLLRTGGNNPTTIHPILRRWERLGQAKIALKCDGGEDDLLVLQAQAVSLGLCAQVIHDAGRTQIAAGSATVLGIGPGPRSVVDGVTGHLKLL